MGHDQSTQGFIPRARDAKGGLRKGGAHYGVQHAFPAAGMSVPRRGVIDASELGVEVQRERLRQGIAV